MTENRRQHRRYAGPALNVTILDPASGQRFSGQLNNCSLGGAEVIVEEILPRGTPLQIQLSPDTSAVAVVKHFSRKNGIWVAGCKFVQPLSDEALTTMRLKGRSAPARR
jgi:PilZ domain